MNRLKKFCFCCTHLALFIPGGGRKIFNWFLTFGETGLNFQNSSIENSIFDQNYLFEWKKKEHCTVKISKEENSTVQVRQSRERH